MSAIIDTSEFHSGEKPHTPADSNSIDEKFGHEKGNDTVDVNGEDLGDVYEDRRAIDLDASGNEKPIGRFNVCATFLNILNTLSIILYILQKPSKITRCD